MVNRNVSLVSCSLSIALSMGAALAADESSRSSIGSPNGAQKSDSMQAARKLIAQKMAMLDQALTSSRLAKRMQQSTNSAAAPVFASAQRQLENARAAWERDDFDRADDALNQVTWFLFRAQSLEPSPDTAAEQLRHDRLAAAVASLRQAYIDAESRLRANSTKVEGRVADIDKILNSARTSAGKGDLATAIGRYEQVQKMLLTRHQSLLGSAAVIYDKRFDSLSDEYRFELLRNHDYQRLVPIAVERYQPTKSRQAEVSKLARGAGDVALQAEVLAADGQHDKAVQMLRASTVRLQEALSVAGLVVPQTMPAQ